MNQLSAMTDHELVELYETGNDRAFDILLGRHQAYIYSYILFLVKDNDVANDFFQETFSRAIVAIRSHKYQTNGKFSAWLMRIAHNLIIDKSRESETNLTVRENQVKPKVLNSLSLSEATREDEIINRQNRESVRKLLDYLPVPQREVVMMRFYDDQHQHLPGPHALRTHQPPQTHSGETAQLGRIICTKADSMT